jgi:hypothetical protein
LAANAAIKIKIKFRLFIGTPSAITQATAGNKQQGVKIRKRGRAAAKICKY